MFDSSNTLIEILEMAQELYVGTDQFIVRVHTADEKRIVQYEDRGTVEPHGAIAGQTGFGGRLAGQLFANGGVFTQGSGGIADSFLGALPVTSEHNRCFRRFEIREPLQLFGMPVKPGIYFSTSEDMLVGSAPSMPPEMATPWRTNSPPSK